MNYYSKRRGSSSRPYLVSVEENVGEHQTPPMNQLVKPDGGFEMKQGVCSPAHAPMVLK